MQVNPTSLQPGTYQGNVTVSSTGAVNPNQTIPVTLLVTNQPILTPSSSQVTFNYEYGTSTAPAQQQIQLTSSGNPLTYNASVAQASGGNFLVLTPSTGTTPGSLSLSINPTALASLAPGSYTETVTITSIEAGNSPINIDVALIVGNNTILSTSQTSLNFNYQTSKLVPAIQTISVASSGAPLNFTVSTKSNNCGGSFLSASPASGSTPGNIAVAINTTLVTVGTCKGTLTITAPDAGNSPLMIPVTLNVSNSPLLNVSPAAINLTAQTGTNPANQTISLTSTDSTVALGFNVTSTTNTGTGWLLVGPDQRIDAE